MSLSGLRLLATRGAWEGAQQQAAATTLQLATTAQQLAASQALCTQQVGELSAAAGALSEATTRSRQLEQQLLEARQQVTVCVCGWVRCSSWRFDTLHHRCRT
jgi:hypothetical protein